MIGLRKILTNTARFIRRLWRIVWLIWRLVFDPRPGQVKFRIFFESAGGAFLKLGQILSLRHDLIPPDYADELLGLLSRVPEESWEQMEQVFIAELGRRPEEIFASFNRQPIASASISQVYRGELADGSAVAVKIQRPGVAEIFETDFVLASFIANFVGIFRIFASLQVNDVVAEFIDWTRSELDFREEFKNGLTLKLHAVEHPNTIVPIYYQQWSTRRVLVSEFMESIFRVEDILVSLESQPNYREYLQAEQDIDVEEMAYYFVFDIARQYFVDGFFHADPHPANLFIARGNRLGYFDFGIMGRLGPERVTLYRIVHSVARRDFTVASQHLLSFARIIIQDELESFKQKDPETYERYLKVAEKIEEIMVDNLRVELARIFDPWFTARAAEDRVYQSSHIISKLIFRSREYRVYLPREVITFFRALVIADMVALRLAPDFDIIKALNRFFDAFAPEKFEQIIKTRQHEIPTLTTFDPLTHLSFEDLLEIKEVERERLLFAKERLMNLVAFYAERYDEVRKLLP